MASAPEMKIKKSTRCYLSSVGHNNFFYPDYENGETVFLEEEENPELKMWVYENKKLRPVLVEASKLENVIAAPGIKTVVWIRPKDLINDENN